MSWKPPMETLEEARAKVRGEKPHRMFRALRDEAALRGGTRMLPPRRRLLFVAARALELLELNDDALRDAINGSRS